MTDAPFPASEEASRRRLESWVPRLRERWAKVTWSVVPVGPQGEPMGLLCADPAGPADHRFVFVVGLHGLEGFAGSAVVEQFLRHGAPGLDPGRHGLWVIHGPNPTGWRDGRKVNHDNVDLNRSFIDRSAPPPANPDYEAPDLRAALEPARPRGLLGDLAVLARLALHGRLGALRRAVTLGQFTSPRGLYFGGHEEPGATTALKTWFARATEGTRAVTVLDLHTGYGPRDTLALVNSRHDPVPPGEWALRLGEPLVQAADGDSFYPIHGDMTDWLMARPRTWGQPVDLWATTLEFGTGGDGLLAQLTALRATVNENAGDPAGSAALRELYWPRRASWRRAVLVQADRALRSVVAFRGRSPAES